MENIPHSIGLLSQVQRIKKKHEESAAVTGENFNIFTILDREWDEVKTHSAVIADLLDPKGSHSQGTLFLRSFLKLLKFQCTNLCDFKVHPEYVIPGGRLDILIEKENACIVIENKIGADDQDRQIERYCEYANNKEGVSKDQIRVVYLTLFGSEPTLQTGEEELPPEVICRSYKFDIISWLDICIAEIATVPRIRETIVQYQSLLRKLTGQTNEELTMELVKLLKEKCDGTYNFELIDGLKDAMDCLMIEAQCEFWENLKIRLAQHDNDRVWRLNVCQRDVQMEGEYKDVCDVIKRKQYVSALYKTQRKNYYFGLTFHIQAEAANSRNCFPVMLRVEFYYWWLCYGFWLVKKEHSDLIRMSGDTDDHGFQSYREMIRQSALKPPIEDDSLWLAYWWPDHDISFRLPDFKDSGLLCKLIEHDNGVVDDLAVEILNQVDAFLETKIRTHRSRP